MNKRALMLSAATVALLSGAAFADTDITTKQDSPINTQTDGNITIESDGSVIITTNPPTAPAVTINSNAIVDNEGQITYNGATGATGVELVTGNTGEYEMTGKMALEGGGTEKTAILISGPTSNIDSGTFTGVIPSGSTTPVAINIESGSEISVQGDDSFGINQITGTNIVGDIDIAGTLSLAPTSASSIKSGYGNLIAINLQSTMTGNIDIQSGGLVTANGEGALGIQTLGTITGSITNNGTLDTLGIRTPSSNVNANQPEAGTALGIGASVTDGVYNAGPSTIADTTTTRAIISTIGNAPTVLINPTIDNASPTSNLTIGVYTDTADPNYSFLNRGTISGSSTNPNIDVTTFSIAGASQNVETILPGGLFNGGGITAVATTNDKESSVTANALVIGAYALIGCTPTAGGDGTCTSNPYNHGLTNSNESGSGTISATVSGPETGKAVAIYVAQYGDLPIIDNSGTISATATTDNPNFVDSLSAYAIYDASGTIQEIDNSGTISATATTLKDNAQIAVAADLAVSQSDITFTNSGTVLGNILFGSGADTLTDTGTAQQPATITGNVNFGGTSSTGGDDTLTIGEFGTFTGAVTENLGSYVDVTVASGGTLNLQNTPENLGANNVTGLYAGTFDAQTGASLGLVVSQPFNLAVNPTTGALIAASQSAILGNDINFDITFGSYIGDYLPGKGVVSKDPTASFDLISAPDGQLSVSQSELNRINSAFRTSLPYLFTGDLCVWNIDGQNTCDGHNPGNSEIVLNLTPKTPAQLGLTGYALKMFPYANAALTYDDSLGAALLNNVTNASEAQTAYAAFAPDVSGAERALAISLTDSATDIVAARQRTMREYANQDGDLTMWTQEFAERLNQDNTSDGTGYTDSGFGFVLGADEGDPADGRYGGAFTFFSGGMSAKPPNIQKTNSEWYMLTGYTDWRGRVFFLDTQASVGYANFSGSRTINLDTYSRTAEESHPGEYLAGGATAGLQYNVIGAAVMPQISLDGLAMRQEGYTEEHGNGAEGDGFDLHVDPDYAASARAFAGVDTRDDINLGDFLFQPEARAGYRYDFANGQESVTANFAGVTPIEQFKISGPKPSPGNAVAGGGVALSTGAWSLGLSFDYLYANSGNTSEEGTLTLIGRI